MGYRRLPSGRTWPCKAHFGEQFLTRYRVHWYEQRLEHCYGLVKYLLRVCGQVHMQRFVWLRFGALATERNLGSRGYLQALLRRPTWAKNLPNEVHLWVFILWYCQDFGESCASSSGSSSCIGGIQGEHLCKKNNPLLQQRILLSLFARVHALPRCVQDGFGRGRV